MENNTCCFIGHRTINETEELKLNLIKIIENLITEKSVDTFLFGSKSRFDDLCHRTVTELKKEYTHIKRIYVRAEYPYVDGSYIKYLLEFYEDTYYPEKLIGSGRAAYVERNRELIDNSRFCIFYYDEEHAPTNRKSGTKIAFDYAAKKGKQIINVK
ncbi:MAG: hypothetical protein UHN02_06270 [Acutalibacteraceae bacterium]|nr:hypothetical protein [Acutalibacteraceae bacterium]